MNWLQAPEAAALGRTLLHSLWEGGAVAATLALILRMARTARVRYAAACFAMLLIVSVLALTFVRLLPGQAVFDAHLNKISLYGLKPAALALREIPPPEERPIDNLAWLVPIWIAGV